MARYVAGGNLRACRIGNWQSWPCYPWRYPLPSRLRPVPLCGWSWSKAASAAGLFRARHRLALGGKDRRCPTTRFRRSNWRMPALGPRNSMPPSPSGLILALPGRGRSPLGWTITPTMKASWRIFARAFIWIRRPCGPLFGPTGTRWARRCIDAQTICLGHQVGVIVKQFTFEIRELI